MAKTIIDLTYQSMNDEIKTALRKCSHSLYQKAFSLPDMHQELIIYLQSRIASSHTFFEQDKNLVLEHNSLCQRTTIEIMIYYRKLVNDAVLKVVLLLLYLFA